jgi:hypothetical protein
MYYKDHILMVQDHGVHHGHSSLTQRNTNDLSLLRPLVTEAKVRNPPEETWNSNIGFQILESNTQVVNARRVLKEESFVTLKQFARKLHAQEPAGWDWVGTCFRSVAPSSHL